MTETAPGFTDGNSLAGPLSEVFAVDLTVALATCAACGRRDRLAGLHVYASPLGMVARCAGCDNVVLRISRTPDGAWLDLRGTVALRIPLPQSVADAP